MAMNFSFDLTSLIPQSTNTNSATTASATGKQTQQKILTQEGINKLIYDVMSSDQGLAALASGENTSGGYGSTSKSILSQDLVTKLVGELANVTAQTVTDTSQVQQQNTQAASKKKASVICTELLEQGKLDISLYAEGVPHFEKLNPTMIRGYHLWAIPVVKLMRKSPKLSTFLLPIVIARYKYVITGKFNILGALTVHIGQPICHVLGYFTSSEIDNGNHIRTIS